MNLHSLNGNIWESIYAWYQSSLIRDLVDYFNQALFGLEFGVYDNFSVDGSMGTTVRSLIIGIMFGTVFAGALMYYTKNVHGKFIHTLLKNECFTPENAMTLREIGLFRSPSVRRDLASGGVLAKLTKRLSATATTLPLASEAEAAAPVSEAEQATKDGETEQMPEAEGKGAASAPVPAEEPAMDFLNDRFYIPEELKYKAEVRYDRAGSGKLPFVITVVACITIAILLCRFMPTLLGFADWLISALAPA